MIRIQRPAAAPDILATSGDPRTAEHCAAYEAHPHDYRTGKRKFVIESAIYAHATVKAELTEMQRRKCCYCESVIGPSYGAVEHFRPKGAVRDGGTRVYPGYYWVAYSWENLLFICDRCNRAKWDRFPLQNPAARARSHNDDMFSEQAILIDPAAEEPGDHIGFDSDAILGLTQRGKETIALLKLDSRPDLVEGRLRQFKRLRAIAKLKAVLEAQPGALLDGEPLADIVADLEGSADSKDVEFRAMAAAMVGAQGAGSD